MPQFLYILVLSLLGFLNAAYLFWQYRSYIKFNRKMFCLIGEDCAKVVGSIYGKSFRVKNEIWGLTYYSLVFLLSIVLISSPSQKYLILPLTLIASVATIFSFYLLYVQTRVLKELCSWCLIAIAINILIFLSIIGVFSL